MIGPLAADAFPAATQPSAVAPAAAATGTEKMRAAAAQFETVFMTTVLETMFSGVESDSMFGGGKSEGIYRSMFLDEVAKSVAKRGGLGIADSVMREMLRQQEAAR